MEEIRNTVLAILFVGFIGGNSLVNGIDENIFDLIVAEIFEIGGENKDEDEEAEKSAKTIENISDELLENLEFKNEMIEVSGALMKAAGVRSYYNNIYGINITTDGYIVGRYSQTTTDYEVEQMIQFKEYLESKGIQLLYVNEPAKYIDDSYYQEQFGGETYLNHNADVFLQRIGDSGIDYIDLRDNILEEGIDPLSLFYRTDHHWTVPASKWTAEIIAERLNEEYGYNIDLNMYNNEQFNTVLYRNAWLGEQGKKLAKSYIGLDDYTMMEPKYGTSYDILTDTGDVIHTGDFGLFINKDIYDLEAEQYTAYSWHYAYSGYAGCRIHNNYANVCGGKILVLGDSYESSMIPFLTLGVEDITLIVPRNIEGSVRDYIEADNYDTVIIAYAQSMIGSHDNENSANYKMFSLE